MPRKYPVWERKLIYMVRAGSHAYGTSTPVSDIDLRGICLLDRENVYGNQRFQQYEPKKEAKKVNDIVVYGVIKFLNLAATCNPNIIELFAIDDGNILYMDDLMERIRSKIDLFLTLKARHSFSGYAFAQLKLIERHRKYLLNPPKAPPQRSAFGLPEHRSVIGADEMNAYMWLVTQLLEQTAAGSKLSQSTKDELDGIDWTGMVQSAQLPENCAPVLKDLTAVSEEMIQAVMAERRYKNAMKQWQGYQEWKKNRHPERAKLEAKFGYDTKNALHLCRLMNMGIEILEGKGVIVKRPEAEWLLSILRGAMKYEELVEWAKKKDKEIIVAEANSKLPHDPDFKKIEELQMELVEEGLSGFDAPIGLLHDLKILGEKYDYENPWSTVKQPKEGKKRRKRA